MQAMEESRRMYYGPWRGRLPRFQNERWMLLTQPELHDDWNEWEVSSNMENNAQPLLGPSWTVYWHGVWIRPGGWAATDFKDLSRNTPWSPVSS